MSDLLIRNRAPDADGLVHRVTPESAGWTHVGFEVWRLNPGQRLSAETGHREACLVLIGGRADIRSGSVAVENYGERDDPFAGPPHSFYVPAGDRYEVVARTPLELAVCTAPGSAGARPARAIPPDSIDLFTRGSSTNTRHVRDILPETKPADGLLVVEVITPSGSWSSYPSHKHDTDNLPEESRLEETYYHRLNPAQGFALQRVYTDDRSLDAVMAIEDGDLTLVPRGYHPVGAAHGYDLYYLNVMAGPKRTWRVYTEPAHRWLLG